MKDVLITLILIIIPQQVCISDHVVHLKYLQLIFVNYPLISVEKEKETRAFLRAYVKMLGSRVESPFAKVNFFIDQQFMRKAHWKS